MVSSADPADTGIASRDMIVTVNDPMGSVLRMRIARPLAVFAKTGGGGRTKVKTKARTGKTKGVRPGVARIHDETKHPRGPAGQFKDVPGAGNDAPRGARKAVASAVAKARPSRKDTEAGLKHRKLAAAATAAERAHRTLKAKGVTGKAYTDALDRSIRLKRATHAARQERARELVALRSKQAGTAKQTAKQAGNKNAARSDAGPPIARKLKAYKEGDRLAAKVAKIKGPDLDGAHKELAGHREKAAGLLGGIARARPGSDEHRRLLAEHAAAVKTARDTEAGLNKAAASQREAVLKVLGVKNPQKWQDEKGKAAAKLPEPARAQQKEAAEFIGKLVGDRGKAGTIGWTAGAYGSRSDYEHRGAGGGRIKVSGDADTAVVVHEWGHAIEHQVPGVRKAARDFLAHRVGNEKGVPLSESIGAGSYRTGEVGRSDRFAAAFGEAAPYVGKEYGTGATEVVSMGLEKLYRDPVGFARKDPEYFKFLVGTLKGDLR